MQSNFHFKLNTRLPLDFALDSGMLFLHVLALRFPAVLPAHSASVSTAHSAFVLPAHFPPCACACPNTKLYDCLYNISAKDSRKFSKSSPVPIPAPAPISKPLLPPSERLLPSSSSDSRRDKSFCHPAYFHPYPSMSSSRMPMDGIEKMNFISQKNILWHLTAQYSKIYAMAVYTAE